MYTITCLKKRILPNAFEMLLVLELKFTIFLFLSAQLLTLLRNGHRLISPWVDAVDNDDGAALYRIMCQCWAMIPVDRPTFSTVLSHLEQLIDPKFHREQRTLEENEKNQYSKLVNNACENSVYLELI